MSGSRVGVRRGIFGAQLAAEPGRLLRTTAPAPHTGYLGVAPTAAVIIVVPHPLDRREGEGGHYRLCFPLVPMVPAERWASLALMPVAHAGTAAQSALYPERCKTWTKPRNNI